MSILNFVADYGSENTISALVYRETMLFDFDLSDIFIASCEAFGITCGANSFCDVDQCKCYEGFLYNGTHCNEDPDFGKEEEPTTMQPDAIGEQLFLSLNAGMTEQRGQEGRKMIL